MWRGASAPPAFRRAECQATLSCEQTCAGGWPKTTVRTSMVDLYRLPADTPAFQQLSAVKDPIARAEGLEQAIAADLGDERLFPYIQVHEFEALLLAEPERLGCLPGRGEAVRRLVAAVGEYDSPEHIDGGEETHPCARIVQCVPGYSKVVDGPQLAALTGLERLRNSCRHFGAWLTRLEDLGAE
ncbi:MAG: DUF4276 family protein [Bryobacteraceae bacterium]|nr:DUF4276 family protein [Bryobacteraceae bacterium]